MRPESQHVVVSADVAVVHAILDTSRAGKRGEAHTSIRVFTTLVWMRRQRQWKLILRQATKLSSSCFIVLSGQGHKLAAQMPRQ